LYEETTTAMLGRKGHHFNFSLITVQSAEINDSSSALPLIAFSSKLPLTESLFIEWTNLTLAICTLNQFPTISVNSIVGGRFFAIGTLKKYNFSSLSTKLSVNPYEKGFFETLIGH
jgi:hypothetical protein